MQQMILVSLLLLSQTKKSSSTICFEDPEECLKNNIGVVTQNVTENSISSNSSNESEFDEYEVNDYDEFEDGDIGVRSSYVTGRYCFTSFGYGNGYSGTCQFSNMCRG